MHLKIRNPALNVQVLHKDKELFVTTDVILLLLFSQLHHRHCEQPELTGLLLTRALLQCLNIVFLDKRQQILAFTCVNVF